MSDILDRAEALSKTRFRGGQTTSVYLNFCRRQYEACRALLPELIAEIKRLRKQHEADWEKFSQENKQLLEDRGRLAAYVTRLEAAYLESEEERITRASYSIDGIIYADRMAREALERIRGEQE